MTEALTTIDSLVASVWQSYVAANELILNSARIAAVTRAKYAEAEDALHRQARFIINNALGKQSGAIPFSLFYSGTIYHLQDLRLELPCYTRSGLRFFGGERKIESGILHAFAPTRKQRLFYVCHLYHLVIKIDRGAVEVTFLPAFEEEAMRLGNGKTKSGPRNIGWKFRLTPEQEKQLRAVHGTVARPVYWRSSFRRLWEWIGGKSKQSRRGK